MKAFKIDRRPWGTMLLFIQTNNFWLKYIFVKERTSLQSHERRTEYHISIRGIRKITPNSIHQMTRGRYFEVAFGHPTEEDIDRYKDDFGRISKNNIDEKVIVVSGNFDPVHTGHVHLFRDAKNIGDKLIVIIHSDSIIQKKRGRKPFMKQNDRQTLLMAMTDVDDVCVWEGQTNDVSPVLERIRPYAFVHGGAVRDKSAVPEAATCERIGIKTLFNMGGGKIHSSAEFLQR